MENNFDPQELLQETIEETAQEMEQTAEETAENAASEIDDAVDAFDQTAQAGDPLAGAFTSYQPEPPKPRRWPSVLLGILLAAVLVFGLLWAFGVLSPKGAQGGGTGTQNGGTNAQSNAVAASSNGQTIDTGMFGFDMEMMFQSFKSQYSYHLSALGLDTEKSLKEQECGLLEDSGSWFDYFVSRTKSDAEWVLIMSQEAAANGLSASETAEQQAQQLLENLDSIELKTQVTKEQIAEFLRMYNLASAQENAIRDSFNFTDEQAETLYAAAPNVYDVCDYAYYVFSIGSEDGDDFTSEEAAAQTLETFKSAKTAEEFKQAGIAYLMSSDPDEYETEDDAAAAYDANCVRRGVGYQEQDGISDWLFDKNTAVGDTKSISEDGVLVVCMLLTPAHRDDSVATIDVRHILLKSDSYDSDEEAKAKAEEVLAEWKAGAATADSFGELAAKYSEDSNAQSGGLYTGVTPGQMVATFNDWCFDPARKAGDSGIVKTEYGYHVMYFEGAHVTWRDAAFSTLENEAYTAIYKNLQEKYPVTFDDKAIAALDL